MRTYALLLVLLIGPWLLCSQALGDPISDTEPLWTILKTSCLKNQDQTRSSLSISTIVQGAGPAVVALHAHFPTDSEPGPTKPSDLSTSQVLPEKPKAGIGSGFFIRQDGYLVTSHHVVDGTALITARTARSGEVYDARVVGMDPYSDLALLKVETSRTLPVLPLGNSTNLPVGAWVVAIGNPFGIEQMVTLGIISGKGRVLKDLKEGQSGYFDLIQTDALIQMGSSGGPLLNLCGEVVGVITAINRRAKGIGFAVPVDLAKEVLPRLYRHGRLQRAYLGLRVDPVSWKVAKRAGLKKPGGVLVTRVLPKTPASKAGMKVGDLVLKFAGHDVKGPGDMNWRASTAVVGEAVQVVIQRHRRPLTLYIKPIARASRKNSKPKPKGQRTTSSDRAVGLHVTDLDPIVAKNQGLLKHVRGVVVLGFDSESAAKRLQIGDIITEVQGEKTPNTKSFKQALQRHKNKPAVRFTLVRQGRMMYVALPRHQYSRNASKSILDR